MISSNESVVHELIMQFIDEIERIDSFSPLRRNVKAALSRRETEVIVMRRLFNYERSCGRWSRHKNYRQYLFGAGP